MLGKHHSEKSRQIMSLKRKGFKMSEDQKIKLSIINKGKKLSEETKKKIGLNGFHYGMNGKKHSNLSRKKISESIKGEKHYNWKGGINIENERIRHSLEWKIWRDKVYKRDKWICRLCGIKCERKNIAAHHIKLFSNFPELRFNIDNGLTLCRSCHFKIHINKVLEGEVVE